MRTQRKLTTPMQLEQSTLPPKSGKPHVVILGAGASRAACPNGDKYGRKLPLMNDLIDALGLEPALNRLRVDCSDRDFERIYAELTACGELNDVVADIERAVFDYFFRLYLPEEPTVYDHLVLSLRRKDLIATFNWDRLLWQALCRNAKRFGDDAVPQALYLHGSVAIGYCNDHMPRTIGSRGSLCNRCGAMLTPSRLLYPVTQKNYAKDPSIADSWEEMQRFLKHAYLFTVFGYRAPATDVEAIRLMKEAWGDPDSRHLEEIQIIDIRGKDESGRDELYQGWEPLICRDHYGVGTTFYQSLAALHPRRSCEHFWEAAMQNNPQLERPIPAHADWDELATWIEPLLQQERNT